MQLERHANWPVRHRGSDRLMDTMDNRTPSQLFRKMKRMAILAAVKLGLPCTYLGST